MATLVKCSCSCGVTGVEIGDLKRDSMPVAMKGRFDQLNHRIVSANLIETFIGYLLEVLWIGVEMRQLALHSLRVRREFSLKVLNTESRRNRRGIEFYW